MISLFFAKVQIWVLGVKIWIRIFADPTDPDPDPKHWLQYLDIRV